MSETRKEGFGRWPWSWPVEVPARIEIADGIAVLTSRGVIYDFAANVGPGYEGQSTHPSKVPELGPLTLDFKVGRGYLRSKLRSGDWKVVESA